jgi:tetratricopeptide (TPR) repeat protein
MFPVRNPRKESFMQSKLCLWLVLTAVAVIGFYNTGCGTSGNGGQELFNQGGKLFEQANYDGAIQKYLDGLQKDPTNAVGYNLLGMAYRFKFNQAGAQEFKDKEAEAFKKAIELDPKFWVAYKNLSATLYFQGKKKEAVPYLEKALELQPNDPEKSVLLQWIEEGKK